MSITEHSCECTELIIKYISNYSFTNNMLALYYIKLITKGLSFNDAKKRVFERHNYMSMIYTRISSQYDNITSYFSVEQWKHFSQFNDVLLDIAIELYGKYTPSL